MEVLNNLKTIKAQVGQDSTTAAGTAGPVGSGLKECSELEWLLRQMLNYLSGQHQQDDSSNETDFPQEVVFDLEVDGVRYILTRSYPEMPNIMAHLSARELEIVRLVSNGLSNKIIAAVLDISPWTVATHLRRIFAKLSVNTRAEMIARVSNKGMLRGSK